MNDRPGQNGSLDVPRVTWAVLLGRWIDFARSAVALPHDEAGARMRQSVPDVIMLQAVWFALQHVDELDPSQRALGLDRAEILINKHARALRARFGSAMPRQIRELIADARRQLTRSSRGRASDAAEDSPTARGPDGGAVDPDPTCTED